jgi:uncharacterized protein (DUF433 family)
VGIGGTEAGGDECPRFFGQLAAKLDDLLANAYFSSVNYRERIVVDPHVRSGKPCVRGTRITVADVFDYLGGGMSVAEILEDFPDLTAEDLQACFSFAADRERHIIVAAA